MLQLTFISEDKQIIKTIPIRTTIIPRAVNIIGFILAQISNCFFACIKVDFVRKILKNIFQNMESLRLDQTTKGK